MKLVLIPHEQFVLFQNAYKNQLNETSDTQTLPNQNDNFEKNHLNGSQHKQDNHSEKKIESIITMLPKPIRSKSRILLDQFNKSGIFYTENGEISIGDNIINHSHICDILHFMQYNSQKRPVGIVKVLENLKNTPKSLISNPDIQIGGSAPPPGIPDKKKSNHKSWAEQWSPL